MLWRDAIIIRDFADENNLNLQHVYANYHVIDNGNGKPSVERKENKT